MQLPDINSCVVNKCHFWCLWEASGCRLLYFHIIQSVYFVLAVGFQTSRLHNFKTDNCAGLSGAVWDKYDPVLIGASSKEVENAVGISEQMDQTTLGVMMDWGGRVRLPCLLSASLQVTANSLWSYLVYPWSMPSIHVIHAPCQS